LSYSASKQRDTTGGRNKLEKLLSIFRGSKIEIRPTALLQQYALNFEVTAGIGRATLHASPR